MKPAVTRLMIDKMYEKVSALMDDEAQEYDTTLLHLKNNAQARHQWRRMHLIRDVIQKEFSDSLDASFANQVSLAIDSEVAYSSSTRTIKPDFVNKLQSWLWFKPVAGLAIAASVAAMSVLGLRYFQPAQLPENGVIITADSQSTQQAEKASILTQRRLQPKLADFKRVNNTGTYWVIDQERISDAALENRLNTYLTNHLEFATMGNVGGVLPYSRIVGYDEKDK